LALTDTGTNSQVTDGELAAFAMLTGTGTPTRPRPSQLLSLRKNVAELRANLARARRRPA
jgi:hypothetical protein